jgi:hypothetical protein
MALTRIPRAGSSPESVRARLIGAQRRQRLDEEERPLHVDVERTLQAGLVPFLRRPELGDAGVYRQDVEAIDAQSMWRMSQRRRDGAKQRSALARKRS